MTVDHPNDAGFTGIFYAKAVGGCPCCGRELAEPCPSDLPVAVTCPGCEAVLRWMWSPPEFEAVPQQNDTTFKEAVRELLIEVGSVLDGAGVPEDDSAPDGIYSDPLISPLSRRVRWLARKAEASK